MLYTPFFPPCVHQLAPLGSRTAKAVKDVGSFTLCQLEKCFAPWMPVELFPKALEKANSRDQHYTRWRTFWCMIWQSLNPNASGREVVRQLQALFQTRRWTHPFRRGRRLLPRAGSFAPGGIPQSFTAPPAKAADQMCRGSQFAPGPSHHRLPMVPRSLCPILQKIGWLILPIHCPKGPSFPMMRIVVLWSFVSGAILPWLKAVWPVSELSLLDSAHQPIGQRRYSFGRPGLWQLRLNRSAPAHPGSGFCRPAHAPD